MENSYGQTYAQANTVKCDRLWKLAQLLEISLSLILTEARNTV